MRRYPNAGDSSHFSVVSDPQFSAQVKVTPHMGQTSVPQFLHHELNEWDKGGSSERFEMQPSSSPTKYAGRDLYGSERRKPPCRSKQCAARVLTVLVFRRMAAYPLTRLFRQSVYFPLEQDKTGRHHRDASLPCING